LGFVSAWTSDEADEPAALLSLRRTVALGRRPAAVLECASAKAFVDVLPPIRVNTVKLAMRCKDTIYLSAPRSLHKGRIWEFGLMLSRLLVFSTILLMCLNSRALAHASLLESVPQPGAVVAGDNVSIELRFDSRLDARFSRLELVKPDGGAAPLTPELIRGSSTSTKARHRPAPLT